MDLKKAKFRLKQIDNDIDYYLTKKELEFLKTQPNATDTTKDSVEGGTREDKNLKYVIKIDPIDSELNSLYIEKEKLENWIERELHIIGEYEPLKKKIIQLREETSLTWDKIGQATGYSERQCRRIYRKYKEKRDIW